MKDVLLLVIAWVIVGRVQVFVYNVHTLSLIPTLMVVCGIKVGYRWFKGKDMGRLGQDHGLAQFMACSPTSCPRCMRIME